MGGGEQIDAQELQEAHVQPMLSMSAMPSKMKRTALTQEVVRIRRNISLELPWESTLKHLNNFSARMRASGYGEKYRFEVLKSGVEGFEKMIAEEKNGGRPINQRRTWMRIRGRKRRSSKRRTGIEVVALMSHSLFRTLQMESWRKE